MVSLEKRGADLDMVDSGNQKLLPVHIIKPINIDRGG